jgi:hypothetical protein
VPEASAQVARCGQFDRTVGVRVAEALGPSTAAMKSRLHRARQALREALDA